MIQLTPAAIQEIKRMIQNEEPRQGLGLRVSVKTGGCSGLSYDMDFDVQKEGDQCLDFEGLSVYVDLKSSLYLDGMTLNYADSLKDKGFRFSNPNATQTCSCGESFAT